VVRRLPKRTNRYQSNSRESSPDRSSDVESGTHVLNVHFTITVNIDATGGEIPVGESSIAGGLSVEIASGKTNTFSDGLQLRIC
jgi:hypothetical protein